MRLNRIVYLDMSFGAGVVQAAPCGKLTQLNLPNVMIQSAMDVAAWVHSSPPGDNDP